MIDSLLLTSESGKGPRSGSGRGIATADLALVDLAEWPQHSQLGFIARVELAGFQNVAPHPSPAVIDAVVSLRLIYQIPVRPAEARMPSEASFCW